MEDLTQTMNLMKESLEHHLSHTTRGRLDSSFWSIKSHDTEKRARSGL